MADAVFGFADIESEQSAIRANQARVVAANTYRQMATPTLAANLSAMAEMYPNTTPSVLLAGSLAGVDPRSKVWDEIDLEERIMREERWGNTGFMPLDYMIDVVEGTYGLAKAGVRSGMIVFDTLWEEGLARPLRATVLDYQHDENSRRDLNWASAWSEASASSGVRALGVFGGDVGGNLASTVGHYMNLFTPFGDPFEVSTESRVNVGSGFFANSDIVEVNDNRVQTFMQRGMSQRDAMVKVTNEEYGSPSTLLFREGADAVQISRNGVSTGVSPGRLGAMLVSEPGTAPFNVLSGTMDLGAQIFLDPSNLVTFGMSKARLLSKGMRVYDNSTGLLKGARNSVMLNDVDKALGSNMGQGALRFLSDTDDLALIDSILSPATRNGQASNELLRQVQVTRNADQMHGVIRGAVESGEVVRKMWNTSMFTGGRGTVRRQALNMVNRSTELIVAGKMPNYGGFRPSFRTRYMDSSIIYDAATGRITRGSTSRNRRAVSRLFSQMSGDRIDISNMSNGFQQVRRLARSLDLNPQETQGALNRWVNLSDNDLYGAVRVLEEELMSAYRKKLHKAGVSEFTAAKMTAIYKTQDEMHKYFVDRAGDPQDPGVFTTLLGNGREVPIPQAHALSEMSGNFIPVPGDPRMIRRMTDFLKRSDGVISRMNGKQTPGSIFYKKDFSARVGVRAADNFMGIWKPMVLLRPAWTLRVVGEEQGRMAAAGLHAFNHPARAFITALSNKNLKLGMTTRKKLLTSDIYGDSLELAQDFQRAMTTRASTWFDSPGGYGAENWIRMEVGSKNYDKWWFREINQLQSDHVSSSIARTFADSDDPRHLNDIKEAFFDGDLAIYRKELMDGGDSARHKALADRKGADAYIDSLNARLHLKTGGRYEVLKDDGWWYDDAGVRLRQATQADSSMLAQASELGSRAKKKSTTGTRIKTRSLDEYESALKRSGMSDTDVAREMRYLQTKGINDNAGFAKLDADTRTVLLPESAILGDDMLADARVVQFKVTQYGNTELINAIYTGNLRGVDFSGTVSSHVERQMTDMLTDMRGGEKPKARISLSGRSTPDAAGDASVTARVDAEMAAKKSGPELPSDQPTIGGKAEFVGGPPVQEKLTDISAQQSGLVNAPAFVKGIDESDVGRLDNVIDKSFDMMMGKQTNRYSRSPVFMRTYWNVITDMADQGLIDDKTVAALQKLFGKTGKTFTTEATRKALKHSELVDQHVRETERFLFELEARIAGNPKAGAGKVDGVADEAVQVTAPLPDDVAEILKPSIDKLNNLLNAPAYDVGRYNRIIDDVKSDLSDIDKVIAGAIADIEKKYADALKQAEKTVVDVEKMVDEVPQEVAEKIAELKAARKDIESRINNLERTKDVGHADTLDGLYGAMDGMPAGYVDGLDPYPGLANEGPSSLEQGIVDELERMRLAEGEADVVRKVVSPVPATSEETIKSAQAAVAKSDLIDDFGPLGQPVKIKTGHYELDTPFGKVEIIKQGNHWWIKTPVSEFRTGIPKKKVTSLKKARTEVEKVITSEAINARKVRKGWSEQARAEQAWPEGAVPHGKTEPGAVPEELLDAQNQARKNVDSSRRADETQRDWEKERGFDAGEIEKRKKVASGEYTFETAHGKALIINETGKEWIVTLPGEMDVLSGMPRRQGFGTLKEATEHLKEASFEAVMGRSRVTSGHSDEYLKAIEASKAGRATPTQQRILTEETLPGRQAPPERLYQEGEDIPVERVFDEEQLRKLRVELEATEEEIQALARAKHEGAVEEAVIKDEAAAWTLFNQKLPGKPNQMRSMEEVDRLAKAAALTATQELLYDLSKRSNFSDMMRNIMPFSEAWFEIVSTWSRLVQGNPATLQRFQQAYMGLKEDIVLPEGAFNIEGHDGHGFFYVDEHTNKEMFAIPYLSAMLQGNEMAGGIIGGAVGGGLGGIFAGGFGRGVAGAVAGGVAGAAAGAGIAKAGLVPEGESVDLAFSVQGMNMMSGSAMPGLGPIATVPVSWVLNANSLTSPLKDLFLPFGETKVSSFGDLVDSMAPSWLAKFSMAVGQGDSDMKRIRANTVMEVAGMMVRRGEGSFSTPEQIKKTLEEASEKSGWLYAIRGMASFAGPTSPTFKYDTSDKTGAWFFTNTMVQKWLEMVDSYDGDTVAAFDEFVGLYGLKPQTFMSGKTKALVNNPLGEKGYAWKLDHEDLYKKYPGTAHLLNPVSPVDDKFSYEAYVQTLKDGSRVAYTPEQWAQKSNQLAANIIMERFRQAADAFLAESPHRAVDQDKVNREMYALQATLIRQYPGYSLQITGMPNSMSPEEKRDEIRRWSPAVKATPAGRAITIYMAARENAENVGLGIGHSKDWWKGSTDANAVEIREELLQIGTMIRMNDPEFSTAWFSMFEGELREHMKEMQYGDTR